MSDTNQAKILPRKTLGVVLRVLRNRNFILILAVGLGLAVGEENAQFGEPAVIPLLGLVMTLSILNITSRELVQVRKMPRVIGASILLNYVVLGGVTLLMARWLAPDEDLWAGFVMLAAVPPAVAVIPFSYRFGGDPHFALVGLAGTYLAAILIVPGAIWLFLGLQYFDPLGLLVSLAELIAAPIVLSRLLIWAGAAKKIERWRGRIVDWLLFLIVFIIIALNRQAFLGDFRGLLGVGAVAIAISFVLGTALEWAGRALHFRRETNVSVVLMGTMKNYALAGGLSLAFYSDKAAIPSSVALVFGILFVTWLGFHLKTG